MKPKLSLALAYLFVDTRTDLESPEKRHDGEVQALLSQRFAAADSTTPAEGVMPTLIGVRWRIEAIRETLRPESMRLRKFSRVSMHGVKVSDDRCSSRKEEAVIDIIFSGCMGGPAKSKCRPPSERFVNDCRQVWEAVLVRPVGIAITADDAIDFLMRLALNVLVQTHSQNESQHSASGGVDSSPDEIACEVRDFDFAEAVLLLLFE